ncbi:Gp19/Gp15/Gp42 family protein [Corynebacterium aurimucosum]|uniref:Gp19/Gp15/Gp42 family protein n=1 Tax=Corynebacterium aurimucosum TaxID=169292 RepID=UPI003990CF72
MLEISAEYVAERLPQSLTGEEMKRLGVFIEDAIDLIEVEFMRCGRDFDQELESVPWLGSVARRVIREMASAAILVGPNAGVRSVSSTTGQESDSITYADVDSVSFGGVRLTDAQRAQLGLCMPGGARGHFPPPRCWPEVYSWPKR